MSGGLKICNSPVNTMVKCTFDIIQNESDDNTYEPVINHKSIAYQIKQGTIPMH